MQNKTFRLFISSTFSDFNQERRLLQTYVFPEIKKYCRELGKGYTFQPIDLRWGVSNEAQLDQKTLELCIDEVKASKNNPHPNFLIMAGDRYGWVPTPYTIEQIEFKKILEYVESNKEFLEIKYWPYKDNDGNTQQTQNRKTTKLDLLTQWYQLDENQLPASYVLQERKGIYEIYENWGSEEDYLKKILQEAVTALDINEGEKEKYFTSATEHEVIDGIFKYLHTTEYQDRLKAEAKDSDYEQYDYDHVYGYIRNIQSLEDKSFNDKFLDKDYNQPNSKVNQFKQQLESSIKSDNLLQTDANLTNLSEDHKNGSLKYSYESIENEKDSTFVKTMIKYLQRSIDAFTATEYSEEALEAFEQTRFREDKLKLFIGRKKPLQAIEDYINNDNNQPFVLYGRSGLGKSAVMAKAIHNAIEANGEDKVIYRFIGSAASLNDSPSFLISILNELGIQEEIKNMINLQTGQDESEKLEEFYCRVHDHLKAIKDEKIIFIDAIDQVTNEDKFLWLPNTLPHNLRIVISALDDEAYKDSKYFETLMTKTSKLYPLEAFENSREMITCILETYKRTITEEQMEYLLSQKDSNSPLYLSIVAQEVRHWKKTDTTKPYGSEGIGKELAPTQKEIISKYIYNLHDLYHHDKEFVKRVFSYLYLTDGLSESELLEIINTDKELVQQLAPDTFHSNETKELPVVIWARLHTQIKEFLKLELQEGQETIKFFHREFRECLVKQDDIQNINEQLINNIFKLIVVCQNQPFESNRWGMLYSKLLINQVHLYNDGGEYDTIAFILDNHELTFLINDVWIKNYLEYNRSIDYINKNNSLLYLYINNFITFNKYQIHQKEWAFEYYDNLSDLGFFSKMEKVPGFELSESNQRAISYFEDALDVAEFLKIEFSDLSRYRRALLNLASVLNDKERILTLEEESLSINDGNIYNDLSSKLNYAVTLRQNRQEEESLKILNSIDIHNIVFSDKEIQYSYLEGIENLYGTNYFSLEKFNDSIIHFKKSVEYSELLYHINRSKYFLKLISRLTHLSQGYLKNNELEMASINIDKAISLMIEHNLDESHSYYKKATFLKNEIDIKRADVLYKQRKIDALLDLVDSYEEDEEHFDKNIEGSKKDELIEAIQNNDINTILNIIDSDVLDLNFVIDEDIEPEDWETPLTKAVSNGNLEIAELLINHGARIETTDIDPNGTVLFHAVINNNLNMVKLLLKYNADIYQEAAWGGSPYDYAKEHDLKEILELFES